MMANWSPWLLLGLLHILVIPYFLFLLVVSVAALLPRRAANRPSPVNGRSANGLKSSPSAPEHFSKYKVVIPAHNEESVIATVVKSCLELNYPQALFEIVVIADNCSDRTAFLAKRAGARVLERFDESKKSKGYAIDYLIGTLEQSGEIDSTDAVVIVDADSTVDRDLLRAFDRELQLGHDWLQAYYTVSNPDDSWRTRLLSLLIQPVQRSDAARQDSTRAKCGLEGQRHVHFRQGARACSVAEPWACRGHGILLARADGRREDCVRARCVSLRCDACRRGSGRRGSATPLGVWPQRTA